MPCQLAWTFSVGLLISRALWWCVHCERPLFLEKRGEGRKTSKRASMTVNVACDRQGAMPRAANNSGFQRPRCWQLAIVASLLGCRAGRLYVERWNGRVRAKRCDAGISPIRARVQYLSVWQLSIMLDNQAFFSYDVKLIPAREDIQQIIIWSYMTHTAPRPISLENHERKGLVWGPYVSKW